MKCWRDPKFPTFVLDPIKIEMLHDDPRILQIYEVLSDKMIDHILEMAAPSMARSRVQGSSESQEIASPVRTSATTWMPESEDYLMAKIPRRVQALTGLRVRKNNHCCHFIFVRRSCEALRYKNVNDFRLQTTGHQKTCKYPAMALVATTIHISIPSLILL